MSIKLILYSLFIPLSIFAVTALKIEHFFRKNSTLQIKIFYIFLSGALAYLVVNFIMDIYNSVAII